MKKYICCLGIIVMVLGLITTIPYTWQIQEVQAAALNAVLDVSDVNQGIVMIVNHLPGDANDDGKLDGRDLIRMKQYFAGYGVAINELNADVNNNGSVDGRDVIRMCQYFAGYDVVLEPENDTQHTNVLNKVTFATNGDDVVLEETSRTVALNCEIGTLPTPTRDFYSFDGWYTQSDGGIKYTEETVITIDTDFTLYAHWTIKPLSDWILASDVPSDARIEQEKWTYTKTSYKESTDASESGWTRYDSYWKQTGSDSNNYATFPSSFDTCHWIYKDFMKRPYTAYDNGSTKREVSNVWTGYVYWHWMYYTSYVTGNSQRPINDCTGVGDNGFLYEYFDAFTSATNYGCDHIRYFNGIEKPIYIVPDRTNPDDCHGSTQWFRFDYCKSSYTDYQKFYKCKKEEDMESSEPIYTSDSISNVQHWVMYRER